MTGRGFDLIQHHRARTRTAEARADALERIQARLVQVLKLAVLVAAGDDCDPRVLLRVLELRDADLRRAA